MSLFPRWLNFSAGFSDASIGLVLIVKWTVVLALTWPAHGTLFGLIPLGYIKRIGAPEIFSC
jgi:hypothetical protein